MGLLIVALCWIAVVAFQLNKITMLDPWLINPIWRKTGELTGYPVTEYISVTRNQPYLSAGPQILCLLSMTCGFLVGRDRLNAHLLLRTFAISGLLYAAYAITAFIFWPSYLLWQEKTGYHNSLVVTFTNPNVAAVYLGACAISWLAISIKSLQSVSTGASKRWLDLLQIEWLHLSRRTLTFFSCFFLVLSAMFMTGSRAGSVFSLLAMSGTVATLYRRRLGLRGLLLVFPFCAAGAIILAIEVLGSRVSQRFDSAGLFDAGRWSVYQSTLMIIERYPWLGTGLGTFRWAFPAFRSSEISEVGIWEQAHSTTLEIASEMGIPFVVVLIIGWLAIFFILGRGMITRKRDGILPAATFWIGLLAVVHSQIDFSLQISGFSVPICTLVGMGLAQSASGRSL